MTRITDTSCFPYEKEWTGEPMKFEKRAPLGEIIGSTAIVVTLVVLLFDVRAPLTSCVLPLKPVSPG